MSATVPIRLKIEEFAQIRSAELEFGDLTVLVGPQGSGKSLALQLFKLALDRAEIFETLRDAGHV
ncbi:MAG: AAA family ATPase, partial [Myxococcota bacterium]